MTDALETRWLRVLPAVADLKLRADFLRSELAGAAGDALGPALRALFRAAAAATGPAREVLAAFVPAVAHADASTLRAQLYSLATREGWEDLRDWLGASPTPEGARHGEGEEAPAGDATTEGAPPAEGPANQDTQSGRPLTLGERKSLARRPDRQTLARALRDPHPDVVRILLDNPALVEDRVVRLAAKRPGRAEVQQLIAAHPLWCARRRVRIALARNPGTPPFIAAPLIALLMRPDVVEILESPSSPPWIRRAAERALAAG